MGSAQMCECIPLLAEQIRKDLSVSPSYTCLLPGNHPGGGDQLEYPSLDFIVVVLGRVFFFFLGGEEGTLVD